MKKFILYACALQLMVWLLLFPFRNSQIQYDMETYQEYIEHTIDVETMSMQNQTFIRRYYHLNIDEYDKAIVYAQKSTMDVEEIAVVQGKNKEQCDAIEQQLLKRIDNQKQIFAGYGIEQMDILEHAKVIRNDQTVMLIITKQPNEMIEAMQQLK